MKKLTGICPVVAMPFTAEGAVDLDSFGSMLRHLLSTGVQGLTLFGIASEFHKLTDAEKDMTAKIFIDTLAKTEVFSMLSVTDHSLEVAVERAKKYEAWGADCLMVLPPFFLNPSQESLKAHMEAILAAVRIPVLIQYAPNETKIELSTDALAALCDAHPNVMFKIESNPPLPDITQLLARKKEASVFVGYAGLYMLEVLAAGGRGVMPGCSFAQIYRRIYDLSHTDAAAAKDLHRRLFQYISVWMTDCEYIIQVEKTILQRRGIIVSDYCRRPGKQLSEKDMQDIQTFLEEFKSDLQGK